MPHILQQLPNARLLSVALPLCLGEKMAFTFGSLSLTVTSCEQKLTVAAFSPRSMLAGEYTCMGGQDCRRREQRHVSFGWSGNAREDISICSIYLCTTDQGKMNPRIQFRQTELGTGITNFKIRTRGHAGMGPVGCNAEEKSAIHHIHSICSRNL